MSLAFYDDDLWESTDYEMSEASRIIGSNYDWRDDEADYRIERMLDEMTSDDEDRWLEGDDDE